MDQFLSCFVSLPNLSIDNIGLCNHIHFLQTEPLTGKKMSKYQQIFIMVLQETHVSTCNCMQISKNKKDENLILI